MLIFVLTTKNRIPARVMFWNFKMCVDQKIPNTVRSEYSLLILIPKYEIEVLIPVHRYFIFFVIPFSHIPQNFVIFSLALSIVSFLWFAKSCSSRRTFFLFFLDVISGTTWIVHFQKCEFCVVNCCFFGRVTLSLSPARE